MHLTSNKVTLGYHKYVQLQAFFSSLLVLLYRLTDCAVIATASARGMARKC